MVSLSQMFSNVIRKGLALFSWHLPSLTDLIIPALMLPCHKVEICHSTYWIILLNYTQQH